MGIAKRTMRKYQTSAKCTIRGKILCEVDLHLLTKEERTRYESLLANIIEMTSSRSSVEEEESISTVILLPVEDSECR